MVATALDRQAARALWDAAGLITLLVDSDDVIVRGTNGRPDRLLGRSLVGASLSELPLGLGPDDLAGDPRLGRSRTPSPRLGQLVSVGGDLDLLWTQHVVDGGHGAGRLTVLTGVPLEPGARPTLLDELAGTGARVGHVATDLVGRVTYLSRAGADMLEQPPSAVLGREVPLDWFSTEDLRARATEHGAQVSLDLVARTAERRRRPSLDLGTLERRSGSDRREGARSEGWASGVEWTIVPWVGLRFPAAVSVQPVLVEGHHVGWWGVFEDVAERDRTFDLLLQAAQREERSTALLAELDRLTRAFVDTVGHELRTPLSSVNGYVEMLQEGEAGVLSEDQRIFVDVIARNADRLRSITDDLVAISGLERHQGELEVERLDLNDVVAEAVARVAADSDREIALELPAVPPVVAGDRNRIHAAVVELLRNAVRFSPAGGAISCALRSATREAVVEVSDEGMGFPEADAPWLTMPFFRSVAARDGAVPGAGLGLAMVADVARRHGGQVDARPAAAGGAQVAVRLPLAAG